MTLAGFQAVLRLNDPGADWIQMHLIAYGAQKAVAAAAHKERLVAAREKMAGSDIKPCGVGYHAWSLAELALLSVS